jgi:subfamily B ATP-binding cassette protein MsbA
MCNVSEKVIRDIKNSIYKKLLGLSMDFYSHTPTGQLMSRITHDSAVVRDAVSSGIADTFREPIKVIVYSAVAIGIKICYNIPWKLIIVAFIVFPVMLYPVVFIGKRLREISRKTQEKVADINNMLLETIAGIKLVKSFNMERYERQRFEDQNRNFYRLSMKSIKRIKIVSPLTETVAAGCVSVIIWMSGKSIVADEFSFGAFATFMAAIFSMMKPIKKLSNVYGINQQALAAADRIYQILDTPVSVKEKKDARVLENFEKDIVFENVFFKYNKGGEYILKGVNLTVKKGEIIALVGPSGGGKTTLVNLIPRFYDPESGSVKIDGIDVKDISSRSLMDKIGLVTQETLLFNDTVRANLSYGQTEAEEDKLVLAAKVANADSFIRELPLGYDTMIGERGVKISGGQRQRVAIARAVYKNPPILILDEATSQLDTENEKLVQDAINNLMMGRTVIAIAHRLSTVMHADKILVVDGGCIVDMGTHKELLARSPLYKKLYDMQFSMMAPPEE